MGRFVKGESPMKESVSDNCKTQNGEHSDNGQAVGASRLPEKAPRFAWSKQYNAKLKAAYRVAAKHVYRRGRLGEFAYAAFDYINATHFDGKLPETLILWDLTEHGHFLGWCRSSEEGPPIIKLHPALVHPTSPEAWGHDPEEFGLCLAFDVLLHECVHASVNYLLGGWERLPGVRSYWTCHNNPLWVAELNRIAPQLGYQGDPFTMCKPRRLPTSKIGKRGKPLTKTERVQGGNAPCLEDFPHCLPGRHDLRVAKRLPFAWEEACPAVAGHRTGPKTAT
jgi:hypothetical protein